MNNRKVEWSDFYFAGYCGNFDYSISLQDDSGLPSFVTFDRVLRQFNVSTSDVTDEGVYTIKVTGIDSSQSLTVSTTFTLTIVNPCRTASLSATTVATQTVSILQSTKTIGLPVFTLSYSPSSFCGTQTYTVTPNPLDSIFTYDPTANTVSVQTNDPAKISLSPYSIQVKVCQDSYPTICS